MIGTEKVIKLPLNGYQPNGNLHIGVADEQCLRVEESSNMMVVEEREEEEPPTG